MHLEFTKLHESRGAVCLAVIHSLPGKKPRFTARLLSNIRILH